MTSKPTPPRTAEPLMTNACTIANRRPHDLAAYQEACRLAEGDPVDEIRASAVLPNMTVLYQDRWLVVRYNQVADQSVSIDFFVPAPDQTAMRITAPTTWMYRRITAAERDRRARTPK